LKQGKILALVMVLALSPLALSRAQGSGASPEPSAGGTAARALEVYEQGKVLYDAQDYAGALERFDQAAELEPDKARWHYNRGLVLRKLGRFGEAQEALLHSRTLDPAYKQAEIDDKLREMGFSDAPPSTSSHVPDSARTDSVSAFWALPPLLGLVLVFVLWRRARGSSAKSPGASERYTAPLLRPEQLAPLDARLTQVADSLIPVEHAMRLDEDADLRALLNQATMAEQRARQALESARQGIATLDSVERRLQEAQEGAAAAVARARELFGERAFQPEGERVGCYFCARPLANPAFRMQVPIKQGARITHVLACPPCANLASAGHPPRLTVLRSRDGRLQHWSELNGYDPYAHRHQPYPDLTQIPSWEYTPERSLGEVAAMAAGGALATGLAAYGVSQLLDLDSVGETAVAEAAARASAKKASEHREERDWKDHS
jgi:tetratricopeptide (TPR) repeat protein